MLEINFVKLLLGLPISDHELIEQLSLYGITVDKDVKLNTGEFTAHVERKKGGFSLVFTDVAMFLSKLNQPIGQGPLYFTGVFFYADGKDGYVGYKGELPDDLDFSYSRMDVLNVLGSPSSQRTRDDGSIIGERWNHSDYSLSVTYSKIDNKLTLVSLFRDYQNVPA